MHAKQRYIVWLVGFNGGLFSEGNAISFYKDHPYKDYFYKDQVLNLQEFKDHLYKIWKN